MQSTLISPTQELNRLLQSNTQAASNDRSVPRFLVPQAPEKNQSGKNGFKKVVQRLFGGSHASMNRQADFDDRPLISASYVKRAQTATISSLPSPHRPSFATFSKTLSSLANRITSPLKKESQKSLLGRPGAAQTLAEYSLSMDELAGGMAAAPPSPTETRLEDRIAGNYKECTHYKNTSPSVSLPEVQVLLNRECAENIRLCDEGRLYLVPMDPLMANPMFLSRTQPTRLGRNIKQLKVNSRVVSRNHCQIFAENNSEKRTFFVVDVGSQTGTYVNGMRLSPASTISSPCVLLSGDILQLGTESSNVDQIDDENLLKPITFLVLIGIPLKTSKPPQPENEEFSKVLDFTLDKIQRLQKKTIAGLTGEHTAALHLEFGDLLHDNSFGCAFFARRDGPCYVARFNNYKLTWEASISEIRGKLDCVLYAECAGKREDQFIVFSRKQDDDTQGRKVARINLKDRKRCVVSPVSEHRPMQRRAEIEAPAVSLVIPRPASPYITISNSQPSSPSWAMSPRMELPFTTTLQENLMISRPEIPFYVLGAYNIYAKDRNNPEKERLVGQGSTAKGNMLRWGKKTMDWQGDLAVCKDDMLIILGILLQQLLSNEA